MTILADIPVAIFAKFFDASLNTLFLNWGVAFWNSFIAFLTSPFILFTADLAPPVSPNVIVVPKTELAIFVTSPVASSICFAISESTWRFVGLAFLFWSPASFCAILSFGFILLVYPLKGLNGNLNFFFFDFSAATVELENKPIITGCCALSPSIKKPNTLSPGRICIGLPRPALPEPPSGDFNTCAQGKSSFFNSTSSSGW